MSWYIKVLKNYAVFSGRARRKEYWWFTLFNLIFVLALIAIAGITEIYSKTAAVVPYIIYIIYDLALIVPTLAVTVRRLHDTNRSGWWFFIGLIPIAGSIVLLVFLALDSQPGENRYGPNPKAEPAPAA